MRGDNLQTFQKKFQKFFFFIKNSRFQVDFCYKKLMRETLCKHLKKKFKIFFFSLKKVDFKSIFVTKN
jgi:hypothetical protein